MIHASWSTTLKKFFFSEPSGSPLLTAHYNTLGKETIWALLIILTVFLSILQA